LSILDESSDLWITPLNTLPIGEAEAQELEEKFG
jgi:hypothetical protein